MMSVASVVNAAVARLCDTGVPRDDARRDAVVIARGLLHWSLADWLARSGTEASLAFQAAFTTLVERRQRSEPVAYLLGEREFYGRPFRVTRDTLIPRPETEGLVDAALEWLRRRVNDKAHRAQLHLADIGTGTGCVAISLALESPVVELRVLATDISQAALDVARDNAARLGASDIRFCQGDLLAGVPGPFDLIVSNPPYVAARDKESLQPDVVAFEPHGALFGGEDGLDVVRRLIVEARRTLNPGGALMIEIGAGQAAAVHALLDEAGFASVLQQPDLQGIARVMIAHTASSSL